MKFIKLIILMLPTLVLSQKNDEDLKVFLNTDINYASSTSDNRKEAQSAVGTLGLMFEVSRVYCSSTFTVHSQNEQITTQDLDETKLFGTNLLLPQNSSSNISNFHFVAGIESFYKKDTIYVQRKVFQKLARAVGFQIDYRINNTTWSKSTTVLPITISSFSADVVLRLLDVNMLKGSDEKIKLLISAGLVTRRLGGDYGLNQNTDLRNDFLGTSALGFNGFRLSSRLEVSKFYGQIDLTNFGKKHNISGFSGDQAIITLGIRADLPLPTELRK
jgi:hypothetical protein